MRILQFYLKGKVHPIYLYKVYKSIPTFYMSPEDIKEKTVFCDTLVILHTWNTILFQNEISSFHFNCEVEIIYLIIFLYGKSFHGNSENNFLETQLNHISYVRIIIQARVVCLYCFTVKYIFLCRR